MTDKPKKSEPLIGYVVIDDYTEDMSDWSGAIAYPNPEGANLFWEKPEPFIQKSAFDAIKKENEELQKERDELKAELSAANELLANNEGRVKKIVDEHLSLENSKLRADLAKYKEQVFVAITELKVKVAQHKQAYGLDIFPNSEFLDDNSSRDSVSAKMGRHMCDCFIRYIDESFAKIGAGDK